MTISLFHSSTMFTAAQNIPVLYVFGVIFNPFSTFQFLSIRIMPPHSPIFSGLCSMVPIIKAAFIHTSGALIHTEVPFGAQ